MITLKNRFINALSQIDVQLQRRYDLIPNIVETARAYLKHESETLLAVTEARNSAKQQADALSRSPEEAGLVSSLAGAEASLTQAMGKFNLVMEAYPDLKADQSIQDLHAELATSDNRVAYARQAHSDAAMRYNTYCEQFPAVLVARLFAFKEAELFEIEDQAARAPIRVSLA